MEEQEPKIKTFEKEKIIRECLNAAANGPFFPDVEFHTLFGLTKGEVRKIFLEWEKLDRKNELVQRAINNSINNLIGYPIDNPEKWSDYISISRDELEDFYKSLFKDRGLQ